MHDKSTNAIALSVVVTLVLFGLAYMVTMPMLHDRRIDYLTAQRAVSDLEAKLSSLQTQKTKLAAEESKVASLLLAFPKEEDIPNLLVILEHIAASSGGVTFRSLTPSEPKVVGPLVRVPVTVAFDGSYDQFKKVIDLFTRSLRPFSVEVVSLSGTESGVSAVLQTVTHAQSSSLSTQTKAKGGE